MHELSIAYSLIEMAGEAARAAGATSVKTLSLKIGKLSGVVKEALLFSFEIAAQGTLLEGATLEIEEIPIAVNCPTCTRIVVLPEAFIFRCPECDTPTPDIVQGKELELVSMEILDESANC